MRLLENDIEIKNEKIRLLSNVLAERQEEIQELKLFIEESTFRHEEQLKDLTANYSKKLEMQKEKFEARTRNIEEQSSNSSRLLEQSITEEKTVSEKLRKEIKKLKNALGTSEEAIKILQNECAAKRELEDSIRTSKTKLNLQLER